VHVPARLTSVDFMKTLAAWAQDLARTLLAVLQQLADHHDQLTQLTSLVTGIGDTLREQEAALAKLAEPTPADDGPDRYRPSPPPPWWKLAAADRQEPIARLRAWVQQVYLGAAGLPARLRPPGRRLGALLAFPRPVPVRPGHHVRPVVGALPAAPPHPGDAIGPGRIPGPHPARPGRPAPARNLPLRPPAHPQHRSPAIPGAHHDRRDAPPGPRLSPR